MRLQTVGNAFGSKSVDPGTSSNENCCIIPVKKINSVSLANVSPRQTRFPNLTKKLENYAKIVFTTI